MYDILKFTIDFLTVMVYYKNVSKRKETRMKNKRMIDQFQLKQVIMDALVNKHYKLDSFIKDADSDEYYLFCNKLAETLVTEFFE